VSALARAARALDEPRWRRRRSGGVAQPGVEIIAHRDDVPALFARYFEVRKDVTGPSAPVHELPFSAAFKRHEERTNQRWVESPGYYAVGMKSYGRAPTFLMATGFEQVRSIVAFLAGDVEAARDVQLELPETGVCNSDPQGAAGEAGCCGTSATAESVAGESATAGGRGTSCGTPEPGHRGPATGIGGGLLTGTLPLVEATPTGSSCCG